MLARPEIKAVVFIGEGWTRKTLSALVIVLVAIYLFREHVWSASETLLAISNRSEAIFSSAFTFLSIFWAAMLTIWSLLKSRATRYIERLTDNAIFRDFLRALEWRLGAGFLSIVVSFAFYIINPDLTKAHALMPVLIWAFCWLATFILLVDSILTARVVLD